MLQTEQQWTSSGIFTKLLIQWNKRNFPHHTTQLCLLFLCILQYTLIIHKTSLFYYLCFRLRLKFSCMMELSRYPLDTQVCAMQISSCEYLCQQISSHTCHLPVTTMNNYITFFLYIYDLNIGQLRMTMGQKVVLCIADFLRLLDKEKEMSILDSISGNGLCKEKGKKKCRSNMFEGLGLLLHTRPDKMALSYL